LLTFFQTSKNTLTAIKLESDFKFLDFFALYLIPGNETLFLEDVGDALLDFRVAHFDFWQQRGIGVAQNGQHVCDRIHK